MSNDLELYDRHAAEWWVPGAPAFRTLHAIHEFRAPMLFEWLGEVASHGRVIDVGCGGGYFVEDFARRGARVLGVDLSGASLAASRRHAASAGTPASDYARGDALALPVRDGCADGILVCDLLEHTHFWKRVVGEAARVLKPGGWMFATTLNRTFLARVVAVWIGEGLGFVPRGTHDASMFIRPGDLIEAAGAFGLTLEQQMGERPRILATLRRRTVIMAKSRMMGVTYSVLFRKRQA
ncbi:MAG: bifunctional 2-polyprenyl-6-hydroxyphenol methylase/3-demethylubiquinol 3-O-methyltransferase UbiG [Planctomycetes bacterium]|nr:bifunctional 2-polyprenyl-6-hydroxyphenol methylase/3-demethylubiquinol 3-O-methyltransferase UbiG [Planctomycetota bacterium]